MGLLAQTGAIDVLNGFHGRKDGGQRSAVGIDGGQRGVEGREQGRQDGGHPVQIVNATGIDDVQFRQNNRL